MTMQPTTAPAPLLLAESYRVVDNFCPRVHEVRQSFLDSGFGTWTPPPGVTGHASYPGMSFHGLHSLMLAALTIATGPAVFPNALFARVTDPHSDKPFIHSDRSDGSKTCIAYLSEHAEVSGTAFYRHRATGLTRMPSIAEMQRAGTFDAMYRDMQSADAGAWEELDFVRGLFNRALIFDAPLFHARRQNAGVGAADEAPRMVWVCHYHLGNTVENQTR